MSRGASFPSADQLAQAFVLAARAYGEIDVLRLRAREALQAKAALRSRWAVAVALHASRRGLAMIDIAKLCGLAANLGPGDLTEQSLQPDWDWAIVHAVFLVVAL
jgi:hypothetical protein